ncbi:MAG: hypothetical protein LBG83_08620 [Oscillospiraceae bacterium]|jgi:hypothetical protein|nr:hypothetical protein [Oscillospiraceae bacterium]
MGATLVVVAAVVFAVGWAVGFPVVFVVVWDVGWAVGFPVVFAVVWDVNWAVGLVVVDFFVAGSVGFAAAVGFVVITIFVPDVDWLAAVSVPVEESPAESVVGAAAKALISVGGTGAFAGRDTMISATATTPSARAKPRTVILLRNRRMGSIPFPYAYLS